MADSSSPNPADALRAVFEQTFAATAETTRERAQELLDVHGLRAEVEDLRRRVAALEAGQPSAPRASVGTTTGPPVATDTADAASAGRS